MSLEQKLEDYIKTLKSFGKVAFITVREGVGSRLKDVDLEMGIVLANPPVKTTLSVQMPKQRPERGSEHYPLTFNPVIKNVE